MKGSALILFCAFAFALGDEIEIELNANGCPTNFTIFKVLEHDTYCNLFYSCVGGERIELICSADLLFNYEKEVCDWPHKVDCAGKGIYVPEVDDAEEGEEEEVVSPGGNSDPSLAPVICARADSDGVLVAHENCNEFYVCETRQPIARECPVGLMYNYDLGLCDWPMNVDCGNRNVPEKPEEDK